jgi:hypothetical protein
MSEVVGILLALVTGLTVIVLSGSLVEVHGQLGGWAGRGGLVAYLWFNLLTISIPLFVYGIALIR